MRISVFVLSFCCLVAALDSLSQKLDTGKKVDDSLFNSGNVHSAFQLVQSLSPGILIAKAGADPNESFDVLARGVTTLTGSNTPLVVVDGVPGISIESIDPNDIASIQFLTGAEAVKYGLLGGAGVMEILTKSSTSRSLGVRFTSFTAIEQKIYQSRVMNRAQFLAAGGNDLGEDRDWMGQITQDAFSYVNQISVDQKLDRLFYRISLNNRQMNGILQESDRKRNNLFGKLGWISTDKKMSLTYTTSLVNEKSAPGFNETFKMALLANPTMPETFPSGDLYDPIQFDFSNPQGFIETSRRVTNTDALHHLSATYDFGFLAIVGSYASFNQNQVFLDQYTQGLKYFANKIQYKYEAERVRSNASLDLHKKILTKVGSLDLSLGIKLNSWQSHRSSDNEVIDIQSRNDTIISSSQSDDINILNTYFGWSFEPTSDIFRVSGRYHVVSSDSHGSDVGAALLYSHHFSISPFARLNEGTAINFHINQGVTGLTPLDTELKEEQSWPNGTIYQEANRRLTFEKQSHFDIGADLSALTGKVQVSANYYIKRSGQLLALNESIGVFGGDSPLEMRVTNEGQLTNRGWELMVSYQQSLGSEKWLSSRLSLTTMDTEWTDMPYSGTTDQFLGIIGYGSTQPIIYQEGEPFGTYYGPVEDGFAPDGSVWFKDLDGDDVADFQSDRKIIGQALPAGWLGLRNELNLGQFSSSFLLRSVWGHDIASMTDMYLNYTGLRTVSENKLASGEGYPAGFIPWSDRRIQSGSYLRLQYLNAAYAFKLANLDVKIQVTANNLFTLSGYQVNDPEVRIAQDTYAVNGLVRPEVVGNFNPNLRMGIQQMAEWLPSRSYVFGLSVKY